MLKGIEKARFDFTAVAGMATGLSISYFIPRDAGFLWSMVGGLLFTAFVILVVRLWRLKGEGETDG